MKTAAALLFSLTILSCEKQHDRNGGSRREVIGIPEMSIVILDHQDKGIAGVTVWVTYPSSVYAPKFVTNELGIAELNVEDRKNIHSLSLAYKQVRESIPRDQLVWPLYLRFNGRTFEVLDAPEEHR